MNQNEKCIRICMGNNKWQMRWLIDCQMTCICRKSLKLQELKVPTRIHEYPSKRLKGLLLLKLAKIMVKLVLYIIWYISYKI